MMILQEVLGDLGLDADHPREVLQSVLELVISSVDPCKRCRRIRSTEVQSQLIDATIQSTREELAKQ